MIVDKFEITVHENSEGYYVAGFILGDNGLYFVRSENKERGHDVAMEAANQLRLWAIQFEKMAQPYKEKPSMYSDILSGKYDSSFTERGEKESLFKRDIEVEFDVRGHSKSDSLFALAFECEHSSGYEAVYRHYAKLVELIK